MKITLEVEDVRFDTIAGEYGTMRTLQTRIAGKQFFVSKQIHDWHNWRQERLQAEFDKALVEMMELMIESILLNAAAAAVPNRVIETRCPGRELWRFHYKGECSCKAPVVG